MARLAEYQTVYDAASAWKDECLLRDGSVFNVQELWRVEFIDELVRDFVDRLDEGKRTFEQKLRDQLAPSSPQAKQLAAEMLWVMMLFPSNIGFDRKVDLVRTVWGWSGSELIDRHGRLDVLQQGIGSGGPGYNNYRPFELTLMIRFAGSFKALDVAERQRLLDDPWRFAQWFDRLPDATSRQLRHMLLHLLFPADFERISSRGDKKAVEKAFAGYLANAKLDAQDRSPTPFGRDRRLWHIRQALSAERPDDVLDYYQTRELKKQWRPVENGADGELNAPHGSGPAIPPGGRVREPNPRVQAVWAIGTGRNADQWPVFADEGIIAIGWGEIGDLRRFESVDQIKAAIKDAYDRDREPANDALACFEFCRTMRVGDEVFAKRGLDRVLGRGVILGDYEFDPSRPDFRSIRRVEWLDQGNWTLPDSAQLPLKTLTNVTEYRAFRDFMQAQTTVTAPAPVEQPYTIDDAAADAFVPRAELERMIGSLERKKNLILQGSPGVGKTFLARRLAYALIGAEAPQNVMTIQFHQSYAYEDFIQGWRPNQGGGFSLRNGIFYEFCRRAQSHPAEPHVFVIDEINRGNLSKVFGELMLLIEADKRGPRFAIPLTYAQSPVDTFFVPDNLYIIGLMNTADRSLAMVDYALRRRFAFATLLPAFGSPRFRDELLAKGVDESTIDRIVSRVAEVNRRITADHKNLGPGFAVGHSYFCPAETVSDPNEWYASVVRDEIEPLLDEYWFDDRKQVEECLKILTD